MPVVLQEFENPESCAFALANRIAKAVDIALAHNDRASLVLSGGNSPKAVLPVLAAHNLDWSRTDILLSDERWVSPDHSASNARLIREYFLERGAAEAVFHPLWVNTHSPSDGLTDVAKKLRKLSRPFDVAYLGMGPDGHIASLFPSDDSSEFDCATSCVLASKAPNDPRQRISMTLSCLLETRSVFLHVTGVEKRLILERASKNAPTAGCPVSLLLHQYPGDLMVFAA